MGAGVTVVFDPTLGATINGIPISSISDVTPIAQQVFTTAAAAVGRAQRLTIPVTIGTAPATALVDSGASICLVARHLIPSSARYRHKPITVTYLNGHSEPMLGQRLVQLTVDGHSYHQWVYTPTLLPPSIPEVVLGLDFLNGRATIDLVHGFVYFSTNSPSAFAVTSRTWEDDLADHLQLAASHISDPIILRDVQEAMRNQAHRNKDTWTGCDFTAFTVTLASDEPFYSSPYKYSQVQQEFLAKKIAGWAAKGLGFHNYDATKFVSPALLADKPQQAADLWRLCGNYTELNRRTIVEPHPMLNLEQALYDIPGTFFGTYDADDAYHQNRMHPDSIDKTTIVYEGGKFSFNFMEYGLVNAGFHWQRHMDETLDADRGRGPARGKWALANIDDVLVWGANIGEYRRNNKDILDRLADRNVRIAWHKAQWALPKVNWCGRTISSAGISASESKLSALREMRAPTSKAELGLMIGLAEWHNSFVPDFHRVMEPIYALRRACKPGAPFVWPPECIVAWEHIVVECDKQYVRAFAGPGVYHLYADASKVAVSSHLVRHHEGATLPMAYAGRCLRERELRWDMPHKELFAIYSAVKKHWHAIQGRKVVIHTDAKSWVDLVVKEPSTQVANWLTTIAVIAPKSVHIRGVENVVCDAINRLFVPAGTEPSPEVVGAAAVSPPLSHQCVSFPTSPALAACLAREQDLLFPKRVTFLPDPADLASLPVIIASASASTLTGPPAVPTKSGKSKRILRPKHKAVFVPPPLREACMWSFHAGTLGCHASPDAMWRAIRPLYWWPGMAAEIADYRCDACRALKPTHKDMRNTMTETLVPTKPWQIVGMDPVPVLLSNGEKVNFVLFADYYSKEIVVSNLTATASGNLLAKFQRLIVGAKSTPELLISDGGPNLTSAAFNEYCNGSGIDHHFSARYHQQGNSFAERCVQALKPILFIKLYKDGMKYKDALFYAAQSLNKNMPSKSTGFTSHELLNGSPYNSPFDNLLRKFQARAKRIKDYAKINVARAREIQKLAYDKGKKDRFFHVGDIVWLLNVRRNKQGQDYWTQSRVIHVLPDNNYVVWDEDNYTPVRANISQLSKFVAPTILPGSDPLKEINRVMASEAERNCAPVHVVPAAPTFQPVAV
ncbi:MAG: hypothetical protein LW878_07915, partial [Proteobacteria bacterium]|nr:hypothetical protein [Pseudomonadota bacterium]